MRLRIRTAQLLGIAVALSACADGTAPVDPSQSALKLLFCAGWQPAWVAVQDGDGAWSRLTGTLAGQFVEFDDTLHSNRGGVALGREISGVGIPQLSIRFGTPTELALMTDTLSGGCTISAGKTWHGATSGLDVDDVALVGLGSSTPASVSAATDYSYTLEKVGAGPQTIFAQHLHLVDNQQVIAAAILRHGVDLPDGAAVPVLDFNSAEAIQPVDGTFSVSGLAGATAVASAGFYSAGSTTAIGYGDPVLVSDAATAYRLLPSSALGAGDLQFLAIATQANGTNRNRSVISFFHEPPADAITIGDLPAVADIAVVEGTRLGATFAADQDYDQLASVSFRQSGVEVTIAMSAAYATLSSRGYELVLPDLSAVPGFGSNWVFQSGRTVLWVTSRFGGNIDIALDATVSDGSMRRVLVDFGTIRLP
jgi:hypothetical protein